MKMRAVLIALIVMLLIVIGTPALPQEQPPDLTGTWVSKFTGTCFDPIEGRTQERGQGWTIYIDDIGDGTFNAMIPTISETIYFGKITSDPKDPDKGAVVFIRCNINDALTIHRSALAWGEFNVNSKKATLDVIVVGYFIGSSGIWEVCDYHDQYVRISSDIPSLIGPCQ